MHEIRYGRTPIGQLLYDLAFAKLSDRWIARKHRMPVAEVRKCRAAARRGLRGGQSRGARKHKATKGRKA